MKRGREVTVRAIGPNTVEMAGPGVYDVCEDLGVPKMRPTCGGNSWWIPQGRSADVMAMLEHRGFKIVVTL